MNYEGIEYVVRASLGHNQWVVLIYYPDNSDGHAARFDFDGSKQAAGASARRRIDNWLQRQRLRKRTRRRVTLHGVAAARYPAPD
jgi:hypothetical protein